MTSPTLDGGVTEASLIALRSMPDEIAAVALDGQMRTLEAIWRRSFLARGLILLEMEQRMLWKHLTDPATGEPYKSLGVWIITAAPQSRSGAYAALSAVKELRDIPREHLEGVSRCNVSVLQALSTAVRNDPAVLRAARDLPEREFIRKIQKDWPSQHIEERKMLHMNPVKSASIVIEQGIRKAMEVEGLTTREQVLELWACNYLAEHLEVEAEDGQDNRESCG